ncbi:MAG TPA: hypothetical protein PKZ41_04615, partial [Candidatus Omnitrophota bacterium]|nr:hypothetical protein [Candidatus Omnitrophota bacterium]
QNISKNIKNINMNSKIINENGLKNAQESVLKSGKNVNSKSLNDLISSENQVNGALNGMEQSELNEDQLSEIKKVLGKTGGGHEER